MPAILDRFIRAEHRKEVERFSKFVVVGLIGFIIDTGLLNLLVLVFHVGGNQSRVLPILGQSITVNGNLPAKAISFTAAVISNFLWNRFWVYPDSRSKPLGRQIMQFAIVSAAGLLITLLVFNTLSNWTLPRFSNQAIALNLAQAGAVVVVLFWNFLVNRLWTYSDVQGALTLRRPYGSPES